MTQLSESVYGTPAEDQPIRDAEASARKTFRYFYRELSWERRRIVPGLELAAVKAQFSDPSETRSQDPDALEVEFMWLMDCDFDGKKITGTLINSPLSLQSIAEGDEVEIAGNQLVDWMYVSQGEVCGGFTVDVMRSRMGKAECKQHDDAWGFDFGDVGIVNLVPPSYIGDQAPKKKGWFSFGKAAPEPQDVAKVAAHEHPMSENMRDSLDDALRENPNFIKDVDSKGFTFLHQLCLAGSLDGVDVCLNHGADVHLPAANGLTPFQLAKSLGWKRVMARLQEAGAAG